MKIKVLQKKKPNVKGQIKLNKKNKRNRIQNK